MYSLNKIARLALVLAIAALFAMPVVAQVTKMPSPTPAPSPRSTPPTPMPIPAPVLLAGQIFDGKIIPKGVTEKPADESISFKDGMLFSTYFEAKGYKTCPYTAKPVKGKIVFTAKAKNAADPLLSLEWTGTVIKDKTTTATSLMATVKQTKEGKPYSEYTVNGTLRAATPTPAY